VARPLGAGGLDKIGDVALDLLTLDGIDQRLVEEAVQVGERLGGDAVVEGGGAAVVAAGDPGGGASAAAFALRFQPVVEPVEVGWGELLQRDMAEVGTT
jgi:hypothetical protein